MDLEKEFTFIFRSIIIKDFFVSLFTDFCSLKLVHYEIFSIEFDLK